MRGRRVAGYIGIGIGIALVLLLAAVLIMTRTDWGRERVRRFAIDRIERAIDGEIEVRRVEGDLLRRIGLIDVAIRDRQGRSFLEADTLETRFAVFALLRQRIDLRRVRIVNAAVVLDKPPGEEWNYVRIFRIEDPDRVDPLPRGWGEWVALRDVTLVNSRVTVLTAWRPPGDMTPAQREEALRAALASETREHVVEVPGGYQTVMDFSQVNAEVPRLLVAHPDTAGMPFEVARLSGLLRPFSPPPARVHDIAGSFRLLHDSLFMNGVDAVLPGSRLSGAGIYALHSSDVLLQVRAEPVAFADLRWLYPQLPEQGGGSMLMMLERRTLVDHIILRDMDLAVGEATMKGRLDLTVGDSVRFGDTDLRFARIETGLVERFIDFDLPRRGRFTGRLAVRGLPQTLQVDSDIRFDDVAGSGSRVIAAGGLGVEPDVRFRELRVRFAPLQAELARIAVPELPVRGTIEGTALLTGTLAALELDADLALRDPRHGLSRVRVAGGLDRSDELRLREMDVRMDPLRLDLLRDEIPGLPAGATATGRVSLDGVPARALRVDGDIVLNDPATGVSGIGATGALMFEDELRFRDLRLRFSPLQAGLARTVFPELPVRGTIEGGARVTGSLVALELDADLTLRDPQHGMSRVRAVGGLDTRDELRLREMVVHMEPLRLDLVRDEFPALPAGAVASGRVWLDGVPSRALRVDGDIVLDDPASGRSEIGATGGVALADELRFDALRVRADPLRVGLLREWLPDLPLAGTLTGTATLNGSPATRIAVRGDVVHREGDERSHVIGRADVATGPGGWATVNVRLEPLSLNVAGRFVPAAGLHGSVAGRLQASGNLRDLRMDADVRADDGGVVRAEGTLDLAADAPGYDLDMRLRDFDLTAVTWRAPAETDLTGTIAARGRGVEPSTMRASITADLTGSGIDDVRADLVRLRLDVEAGLARVDSSVVRLGGAEAVLDGSFGLVAARHGELAYRLAIDSLHAFARWLPGADTAVARPSARPQLAYLTPAEIPAPRLEPAPSEKKPGMADQAASRQYVAVDSARVTVTTTRVQSGIQRPERTATGERQPALIERPSVGADVEVTDTLGDARVAAETVPRLDVPPDSLAGSLYAAGTLSGNVMRFDVGGRAVVDDLVYRAMYVGSGDVEYALADVGTPSPDILVDADLHDVRTARMVFDSVDVRGLYRGIRGDGTGEAVIVAHATDDAEYRADVGFELSLDRSELRIADLMLRFDTVTWRAARTGVVSWADNAIELARIDLVSNAGGRVLLDGRLPVDGSGDLDVVVQELEIAQVIDLLQLPADVDGRLNVDARVQGTLASPRITGTAQLDDARLDGEPVPDVRTSFSYADLELTADSELLDDGRQLAVAEARLPIDLSFTPDIMPRWLSGELAVDMRADSLPVETIPGLSEHVEDARGRISGDVVVRGTFADPVVTGSVDLTLGSVHVVPLDVRFHDIAGRLTLAGGVLRVDSLVARSGGTIRVTGDIGITTLTQPTFGLDIEARETLVIDTDDARLSVDADLSVGGTLALMDVEGEVRTRSGVIYIPELSEFGETEVVSLHAPPAFERIETAFLEERRALQHTAPLLERLRLDVGVRIDRDVWLRSLEANVEIYTPDDIGPLRIQSGGGDGRFALRGAINTDRGEYEFMSRRFDLTRGAVTFAGDPDLNPILQIAAEHEVRLPGREAFDIRVLLGGTLREVEITVESTAQPPIAQTDLLAYLAFGRDAIGLLFRQGSVLSSQGGDAGELPGNVAGLATQQLGTIALDAMLSDLEVDLMRDLGLDLFRITPADLPPDMFTGSYVDVLRSTEVEAGRYVSPRLFVAGQVSSFSRPGVRVEYVGPLGVQWLTSWQSRWLPTEPTLTERDPRRTGVLGSFLSREWRF